MTVADWHSLFSHFHTLWNLHDKSPGMKSVFWRQVLTGAISPGRSKLSIEKEAASFGFDLELRQNWPLFESARKAREDAFENTGLGPGSPAQSVYQTAFDVLILDLESQIDRNSQRRWLYRGQCDHCWSTVASIFRDLPPGVQTACELTARTERARRVVETLRDCNLGNSELESLAIAQHYSKELGVKTWLVDVTESPWIALFFATDGEKRGEVGVLDYIERTEWTKFSDEGKNLAGSIRYISPPGIPRIKNQAALFIDTPHPEIYRQMSVRRLYFHQISGIVFENESIALPVSRRVIYPQDDPILTRLPSKFPERTPAPLSREPSLASISDLTSDTIFAVAQPLLENATDLQSRMVENLVCPLHAELTKRSSHLPHYIVTLHHLERCVDYLTHLVAQGSPSESIARELWSVLYAPHLRTGIERTMFIESVGVVFPDWLSIAEKLFKSE